MPGGPALSIPSVYSAAWPKWGTCATLGSVRVAAGHQARARQIAAELAKIARTGMVLPGSLTERRTRCGYPGCACHADPPRLHGPYWQWTRKVAAKTVGRWLSAEQHHDYQTWIDNDRRLHELAPASSKPSEPPPSTPTPAPSDHPRNQADPAELTITAMWIPPA